MKRKIVWSGNKKKFIYQFDQDTPPHDTWSKKNKWGGKNFEQNFGNENN